MASAADRLADLLATTVGLELPVRLRAWDGSEAGPLNEPEGPVLIVRSRRALRRLLWRPGELGLARAYVTGDIDVEGDLADGLRRAWRLTRSHPVASVSARGAMVAAARAARLGAIGGPPAIPASEARLSGRRHSRRRDRAVIAHHYDLSNDFYRLLLDDHMAYSAAYFTDESQSLHDAQTAKLDLICRKLELEPGMRLLDVGCGWGSLILYAVRHYGVRATGITLSGQQRQFIEDRAAERGLADSVEVRLQDYRDFGNDPESAGVFDAVASIEMGEHVGEHWYPVYLRILGRALKPGAKLLLQQMSRRADAAPGGGAFIEAYIAADMHMRPLWQTLRYLQDADFEVASVQAMREHYARTAQCWIATLEERFDEFVDLLGDEVARVWRLYLAGGMLAFEEGRMGVDQVLAVKPAG
ncbi:cyclopropane-fatty-acyl-phospholipid synthase [Mycobacterium montefiorense]|nr:cyclopropane-fatty-acyl-phospholipid synthase [Mycobacterium montefiorense]